MAHNSQSPLPEAGGEVQPAVPEVAAWIPEILSKYGTACYQSWWDLGISFP